MKVHSVSRIAALLVALAMVVPAFAKPFTKTISLSQAAKFGKASLQAGEYLLSIDGNKATVQKGKSATPSRTTLPSWSAKTARFAKFVSPGRRRSLYSANSSSEVRPTPLDAKAEALVRPGLSAFAFVSSRFPRGDSVHVKPFSESACNRRSCRIGSLRRRHADRRPAHVLFPQKRRPALAASIAAGENSSAILRQRGKRSRA